MKCRIASTSLTSGKSLDLRAHVPGAENRGGLRLGHVELRKLVGALARRAHLEQQRLVLRDVGPGFADHCASASATASICSRVFISVAHRSIESVKLGIEPPERQSADDLLLQQRFVSGFRRPAFGRGHELIEERARKPRRCVRGEVVGLRQVLPGEFAQALLAIDGHEDGRHQGDQRLVGADVGRRLLAPDMLLARGERQAIGPLAARVLGLAHQAARHLSHELLPGRDHAGVGAAEAGRRWQTTEAPRPRCRPPGRVRGFPAKPLR